VTACADHDASRLRPIFLYNEFQCIPSKASVIASEMLMPHPCLRHIGFLACSCQNVLNDLGKAGMAEYCWT